MTAECGCMVLTIKDLLGHTDHMIKYCPLHAAAPELLEALLEISRHSLSPPTIRNIAYVASRKATGAQP